jgi:hypothetical protein
MLTAAARRDAAGGLLMLAIGAAAAFKGREYGVGTLTRMGPGFLPVTLGALLAGLGLLLVLTSVRAAPSALLTVEGEAVETTDWRGVLCILAGMGGFIVAGEVAGLIPASLVCVFVAALGDRTASLKSAALLAIGMSVAGTLLFSYGLGIRFPLLHGW